MYDIEDEIKIFEEREAAYDKGLLTGVLFGIPIGTIGTILIAYLTAEQWLILIK